MTRAFITAALFLAAGLSLGSCATLYPEVATPVKAVPPGRDLDPPPPPNVLYIAMAKVHIPNRTRDGRSWDASGGLPDPFAIVFINDKELFRTAVERDSLNPTWPNGPKTSYELPKGAKLRVEIWDDNAIHKKPICGKDVKELEDHALTGSVNLNCEGGTEIEVVIKAAEAKFGLGFSYEFRSGGVFISKVLPLSPASRAGMRAGSQVLTLMGKAVGAKSEGEVKSIVNSNAATGLDMTLSEPSAQKSLKLKEGPIYVRGN
jgi:Ca2+-dependent lipid-binding protein